jgi:hypothetical protein
VSHSSGLPPRRGNRTVIAVVVIVPSQKRSRWRKMRSAPMTTSRHPAARPRLPNLEPAVSPRWVLDPRTPALSLQAPMGLRPGWRFLAILNPMDQGGLVAPLGEPRHYPAVHARLHKGAHRRFVTPDGAGPESAIGITEYSYREASRRPLGLVRRTDRLENKLRQVAPTPNPETRDGHEGHAPNTPWAPANRAYPQAANAAAAVT